MWRGVIRDPGRGTHTWIYLFAASEYNENGVFFASKEVGAANKRRRRR